MPAAAPAVDDLRQIEIAQVNGCDDPVAGANQVV